MTAFTIAPVTSATLPAYTALLRAIEAEANPGDPTAPDRAAAGLDSSLARFDFTRSDSCWMLLASLGQTSVGYVSAVRIPKADARAGFLFVDELYVLRPYRRAGVARALLDHITQLARAQSLASIRLLVRPDNAAARRLYTTAGYSESETVFCEQKV